MAAVAELHGDPSSGISPELVLIDAVLAAEARQRLVLPEGTLERLREGRSGSSRPEEVAPLAELADDGSPDAEVTDHQAPAATAEADPEPDSAQWALARQEAAPAEELEALINDVASALTAVEHPHRDQVVQTSNSYPTLPSPSPDGAQQDATETVLRLITGTP